MKRNKKFRDTQKSETKSNSLYEPAICVPVPKTQLLEQEFSFFLYLVRQSSSEINERNQFRFCQREVRRNVPFLFLSLSWCTSYVLGWYTGRIAISQSIDRSNHPWLPPHYGNLRRIGRSTELSLNIHLSIYTYMYYAITDAEHWKNNSNINPHNKILLVSLHKLSYLPF